MKKFLMVTTLVAGLLVAGGCGAAAPAGADTGATEVKAAASGTIFEMADLTGDDNGPGTYTYPTDKVFVPGCFDLVDFKIVDAGSAYNFIFTVGADFKNDWKNAGGWDVQMFDVYLNLGEGRHNQTLAGRHVILEDGWDLALLVGSDKPTRMRKEIDDKNETVADDNTDEDDLTEDTFLPDSIAIEGNVLTASIAKAKIDASKLASLQVFMLGGEGFPTKGDTYNRVVNEYSAQWRLGGGSDYFGDPNVIDMLGDNSALAGYESDEGVEVYPSVKNIAK